MTWGFVAVATATIGGAAIASRGASKTRKSAEKSSAAELAFAQEQYDDWQEIYGPMQENLASYFSGLTPEYYEAQGLEAFEQERAAQTLQLDELLAQRGIQDSGVAAALEQTASLDAVRTRAQIRTAAPAKAAEEKLRFLQVGLGQSPSSSLEQTLASQTSRSANLALQSEKAAGTAISRAITTAGTALQDYLDRPGGT